MLLWVGEKEILLFTNTLINKLTPFLNTLDLGGEKDNYSDRILLWILKIIMIMVSLSLTKLESFCYLAIPLSKAFLKE